MKLQQPIVIGLAGKAGSGKNTIAQVLRSHLSITEISFAEPLKMGLVAMLGDLDPYIEQACFGSSSGRDHMISSLRGVTVRHALQTLGTDWGRNRIDQDLWIKIGMARVGRVVAANQSVVVTDVRFENEMRAIRRVGYLWRVERPGLRNDTHESERDLDGSYLREYADFVTFNSGSLEELRAHVRHTLISKGWTE